MNVGELIAELTKLDPNLPVARDGLDGEHSGMHPVEFVSCCCGQFNTRDWDDKTDVVIIS